MGNCKTCIHRKHSDTDRLKDKCVLTPLIETEIDMNGVDYEWNCSDYQPQEPAKIEENKN